MGNAYSENAAWERESQATKPKTLEGMPDGVYLASSTLPSGSFVRLCNGICYDGGRDSYPVGLAKAFRYIAGPYLTEAEWLAKHPPDAATQAELSRLREIERLARAAIDVDRNAGCRPNGGAYATAFCRLWLAIYPDDAKPAPEPPPVGSVWGVRSDPHEWRHVTLIGVNWRVHWSCFRGPRSESVENWHAWAADKERIDEVKQ